MVAANNFMLEGGNGYGMLADGKILVGATDSGLQAIHSSLPADAGGRIVLTK